MLILIHEAIRFEIILFGCNPKITPCLPLLYGYLREEIRHWNKYKMRRIWRKYTACERVLQTPYKARRQNDDDDDCCNRYWHGQLIIHRKLWIRFLVYDVVTGTGWRRCHRHSERTSAKPKVYSVNSKPCIVVVTNKGIQGHKATACIGALSC